MAEPLTCKECGSWRSLCLCPKDPGKTWASGGTGVNKIGGTDLCAGADSCEIEVHEINEAEVTRIHSKGSPHQHLDPTPHNFDRFRWGWYDKTALRLSKAEAKRRADLQDTDQDKHNHKPEYL